MEPCRACPLGVSCCQLNGHDRYFPSGVNLFGGTLLGRPIPQDRLARCEKWLGRLADAEGNFVRLRMDSRWLAIDILNSFRLSNSTEP